MNLQELKDSLQQRDEITFVLPSGEYVPPHFHVTEVGKSSKLYVDCGGTVRAEEVITFQLWSANDYDHRIQPQKILQIIIAEDALGLENLEVEIEYQRDNRTLWSLVDKDRFLLTRLKPTVSPKINVASLNKWRARFESSSDCCPDSGCC